MIHRAILAVCIALTADALAQTPVPPAPNGNAVVNGDFAKFTAV